MSPRQIARPTVSHLVGGSVATSFSNFSTFFHSPVRLRTRPGLPPSVPGLARPLAVPRGFDRGSGRLSPVSAGSSPYASCLDRGSRHRSSGRLPLASTRASVGRLRPRQASRRLAPASAEAPINRPRPWHSLSPVSTGLYAFAVLSPSVQFRAKNSIPFGHIWYFGTLSHR